MIRINNAITKEAYEKGINCRGLCFMCNDTSYCYQYKINKQKELIESFTDEELYEEINRRLKQRNEK